MSPWIPLGYASWAGSPLEVFHGHPVACDETSNRPISLASGLLPKFHGFLLTPKQAGKKSWEEDKSDDDAVAAGLVGEGHIECCYETSGLVAHCGPQLEAIMSWIV